jgi:BirA family biotin operon repressor/biotin-[acetyl-CoA-carboxylase] ligase
VSSFDGERFTELRRAHGAHLGEPLTLMAETRSTNDDAMEAARRGALHGATFVADAQSHGRGRRGARWSSPPGENLLVSVLLRPELSVQRAGTLTLAVGLAVRDVVAARVPGPVRIKWPNDVWVADAKIAGILLESQLEGERVAVVVAGIGLNVAMRTLPEELRGIATSLVLAGDPDARREEVLAELLAELERRLAVHEREGLAPVLPELSRHDALRGRRVTVGELEGTAAGIAEDGALLVDTARGRHRVVSGGVSLAGQ